MTHDYTHLRELADRKQRARRRWYHEYASWYGMRRRCLNEKCQQYPRYGGRGIKVCERWSDFATFLSDMGPRPPGTSLDRIDVNGNYEPGNCRWADKLTQVRNCRSNRYITAFGETKLANQWAEDPRCSVLAKTIRRRLDEGLSPEDAVSRPPDGGGHRFGKKAQRRQSLAAARITK